jgi:mannose-6-phosphate isomerase-like protein (cupin superfamily)
MSNLVNISSCFKQFSDSYSPKIVGELNGQYVMLVRAKGDKIPWHSHDNEDEMFLVIEGVLNILERDKSTKVKAGEFYIVPKGIEHRIVPEGEVKLMLFEPKGIAHTGNIQSKITKAEFDHLETK